MLHVLQAYEWFKEVLKRVSTFEDISVQDHLHYEHNGVLLKLNRRSPNRTILTATAIGTDFDSEIFRCVCYYMNDTSRFKNIYWTNTDDYRLTYSRLYCNEITVCDIKFDNEGNNISTSAVLDYPLKEEQIFQQLTRIDIPEPEYIERYVSTSEEIMSALSNVSTITFKAGYICNQINETNHKIMVQSVMDCMRHLELEEQMRIEKRNNWEA